MNNITKFSVFKQGKEIQKGKCPSWYIHGMFSSIIHEQDADYAEFQYTNGKSFKIYSPKILHKMKPECVSLKDHQSWFSGNRYNL